MDPRHRFVRRDQKKLRRRLIALSPRFRVENPTQFKFDLGSADPHTPLIGRLLEILDREPSFYEPVCRYLVRCPRLSRKVSKRLLDVLRSHDLYPGFAAALLRAIRENLHRDAELKAFSYCRSRLSPGGRRYSLSAELRAAAIALLLWRKQLDWQDSRDLLSWRYSWWLRAWTPAFLQPDHIGVPSFQAIVHDLMKDESNDVALVAAELLVTHRLEVPRPLTGVNYAAQQALRLTGKIGRVLATACPIQDKIVATLGPDLRRVSWKTILDAKTYRLMIPRVSVWSSYATTDSTAWIVLTDTINDILLNALYKHDVTLGGYALGNIGSALQPTSRLAIKYPRLYRIIDRVHTLRLEADLSHPVTRSTNSPTRRIPFRVMKKQLRPLATGYLELWDQW